MSTRRLFFALWPDHRQRERLRDFIGPVAKLVEGKHIQRGNWHVTTAFIGNFEERRIPELQARAAEIRVEPFRLRFDRVEFWPRSRIACVVAATVPPELERLVGSLNHVLAHFDIGVEDRAYRPHISLVRRARAFETQRLAQPVVLEWSGFELVESIGGPDGATYRPVNQ